MTDLPTKTLNRCRFFLGLYPDSRPACERGWDVRKWAVRCNGGSNLGIGLRLPCTKQNEGQKPLWDCPSVDRKTDAEIAQQRDEMHKRMASLVRAMPALNNIKKAMIVDRASHAERDCVFCGAEGAMTVNVNIYGNEHMAVKCSECEEGFIE